MDELTERHGRKACLIGRSLSGVMARELAREKPGQVPQVITLGSEEWVSERLREAIPEPSTAIYSRSDGIVNWLGCREPEDQRRKFQRSGLAQTVLPRPRAGRSRDY